MLGTSTVLVVVDWDLSTPFLLHDLHLHLHLYAVTHLQDAGLTVFPCLVVRYMMMTYLNHPLKPNDLPVCLHWNKTVLSAARNDSLSMQIQIPTTLPSRLHWTNHMQDAAVAFTTSHDVLPLRHSALTHSLHPSPFKPSFSWGPNQRRRSHCGYSRYCSILFVFCNNCPNVD